MSLAVLARELYDPSADILDPGYPERSTFHQAWVERIDVLAPIRWESVRRNEVGSVMSMAVDADDNLYVVEAGRGGTRSGTYARRRRCSRTEGRTTIFMRSIRGHRRKRSRRSSWTGGFRWIG